MHFQNGDIVFFKTAKKSTKRKSPEGTFKGHGFGVFLGHVPLFAPDPPASYLLRLMGSIGFISFDDITEFFGQETGAECVKKFAAKYYPETDGPLPLLDKDGNKIPTPVKAESESEPLS